MGSPYQPESIASEHRWPSMQSRCVWKASIFDLQWQRENKNSLRCDDNNPCVGVSSNFWHSSMVLHFNRQLEVCSNALEKHCCKAVGRDILGSHIDLCFWPWWWASPGKCREIQACLWPWCERNTKRDGYWTMYTKCVLQLDIFGAKPWKPILPGNPERWSKDKP